MSDSATTDPLASVRAREECVDRRLKRWMPKIADECGNCGTQLLGPYCHACGQPTKHFIRHLPSVMRDLLEGLFNIDSRILRTLGVLIFRPGRLTMEYIAGRRARYTAPLQLYLIVSVLMFVSLSWIAKVDKEAIQINAGPAELSIGPKKPAEATISASPKDLTAETPAKDTREEQLPTKKAEPAADDTTEVPETPENPFGFSFNGKAWHPKDNPIMFPVLNEKLNLQLNEHILNQVKKIKKIKKNPQALIDQGIKLAPYAMFFLMPLYALMLAVVYVFKRRYYTEHLIFAVHIHCFSFVLQLAYMGVFELQTALDVVDSGPLNALYGSIATWQFFGHLWAQKRVYAQGWIMTTIKYFMVLFAYLMLSVAALLVIAVLAALTF